MQRLGWPIDVAGDRAGDRPAARARLRRDRQGAAAVAAARRAGVGWRWPLIWAAAAAALVGQRRDPAARMGRADRSAFRRSCWRFGAVLWTRGFGPEDRELFRMSKADIEELQPARPEHQRRRAALTARADLVPEVAHPGEQHRQAGLVGGGDHFVVADRAAGLDHRGRAGLDRREQAVGEREEGVRGDRRADRARLGPAVGLGRLAAPWRRRCAR